jgi:hypothetical protein
MISYNSNNGSNGNSRNTSNSTDSKKLHIFRQHASAVSHALWPSDLHRSQAIEKAVQRQRRRYVKFGNMPLSWVAQSVQASMPVLLVVVSTIVGGSIVTALFLHLWYILLIPILFLTLTTLAILQPFLSKLKQFKHTPRPTIQPTPHYFKSSPGFPATRRAPETPIPHTPLVRELETFDLSQTGVEHFLDVNSGSETREEVVKRELSVERLQRIRQ